MLVTDTLHSSAEASSHLLLPLPAAWGVDEKLHTFVVTPGPSALEQGPPQDVWKLRQPSSEQQEVPPAQQVRSAPACAAC